MTGDICAGRINDVGQINLREILLYQFLTKLALHKRVGRDLASISSTNAILGTANGELEDPSAKGTESAYLPEQLLYALR